MIMEQIRENFLFKRYFFDAIENLESEQFKEVVTAIAKYAFYDEVPHNQSQITDIVLILYKEELDKQKIRQEKAESRKSNEYLKWRLGVFQRDNYTCQLCNKKGEKLNAHHIKPYAKYPELRLELSNGITLCEDCHRRVHREK